MNPRSLDEHRKSRYEVPLVPAHPGSLRANHRAPKHGAVLLAGAHSATVPCFSGAAGARETGTEGSSCRLCTAATPCSTSGRTLAGTRVLPPHILLEERVWHHRVRAGSRPASLPFEGERVWISRRVPEHLHLSHWPSESGGDNPTPCDPRAGAMILGGHPLRDSKCGVVGRKAAFGSTPNAR